MISAISSIDEIPEINSEKWISILEPATFEKYLAINYRVCELHIYVSTAEASFKNLEYVNTYFYIEDDWFIPSDILVLKNFSWAIERKTSQTTIKLLNQIIRDLFRISKLAVFI